MSTDNETVTAQDSEEILENAAAKASEAAGDFTEAAETVADTVESFNDEATEASVAAQETAANAADSAEEVKASFKKESKAGRVILCISIVIVILAIVLVIAALIIASSMKGKGRVSQDASIFEAVSTFFSGEDKSASNNNSDNTDSSSTAQPTKAADSSATIDITATPDDSTGSTTVEPIPTFEVTTKLGQYKGIEVDYMDTTVTDADVEARIQSVLASKTEQVAVTDRPCKASDTVNIDYLGKIDGVAFDRGAANGVDLLLGSGNMIPGFEEGIIGHSAGESFVIDVTFPDPYQNNPDMSGKAATFDITIHSITANVLPEFTDEFVTANSEFTNIADYTENLKASIQAEKISAANDDADTNILLKVIDNCSFEGQIEEEISYGVEAQRSYYDNMASQYYGVDGATLFQYFYGITAAQYDTMLHEQSVFSTKITHVLEEIIKAENISYTDDEYQTKFKEVFFDTYGFENEETVYQNISKEEAEKLVSDQLLKDKAQKIILDNAIINGK